MGTLFDRFQALFGKPFETSQPRSSGTSNDVEQETRKLYTVLHIETTSVKAAIVEVEEDQVLVLGVGRHTFNQKYIPNGTLINISSIISDCNEALLQAEEAAGGIIAPAAILSIMGELVKGGSTTVNKQRIQPSKLIMAEETEALISSAYQKLWKSIKEHIALETGNPDIEVDLINAAVISARIDGRVVANPTGFRGRHFGLTLFSAFALKPQLNILETIAQALDLTLITIIAEPYALARCLCKNDGSDGGAIFITVGGGTTDIALVRLGGIEDTRMFALGNRTFIRRIATNKGISLKDAEQLKINYSNGNTRGSLYDEVQAILAPECQTWMDSVELSVEELAKGELLPPAIYLLGEGSALPDLLQKLEQFSWTERLPFTRSPIIRVVHPALIEGVVDTNGLLRKEDVVLMALAYSLTELTQLNNPIEALLERVVSERAKKIVVSFIKDPSAENINGNKLPVLSPRPPQPQTQRPPNSITLPTYSQRGRKPEPKRDEPQKAQIGLPRPRLTPSYYPKSFSEQNQSATNINGSIPLRRSLQIFLCHSSDDKHAVRRLYQQLKADGFNPWLDEEKLLPGDEWQIEIPKAVRNSHVVIVCLSRRSIQKTGYVQKEIKYALDVADEQPEGTIFMIPLKLEECNVPERLGRWHWVNFFEANGYTRLMSALRKRAKDI